MDDSFGSASSIEEELSAFRKDWLEEVAVPNEKNKASKAVDLYNQATGYERVGRYKVN
jgi:hypothetical protein